jgi:outer membrane protein OmpA-like peptidoglycan-associated protein
MRRQLAIGLSLIITAGVASCGGGARSAFPSLQIPARTAAAAWGHVDEQPWWTMSPGSPGSEVKRPQTFAISGDILFEVDSSILSEVAGTQLERIATVARNSDVRVLVRGYTDSDGTVAHNQQLSQSRARSVADWLILHGVARSRINAEGLGEANPIVPNDTPPNKAENRRVTITISPRTSLG